MSCVTEGDQINELSSNDYIIINHLTESGFDESEITISDTDVMIGDDAGWSKDCILSIANGTVDESLFNENLIEGEDLERAEIRQRGVKVGDYYHSINWYYADEITYYLQPSI